MKSDILNKEDIKVLVDCFYAKVKEDDSIGYIFQDIMAVDWNSHLPKMYRFWESILLGEASFRGNPMLAHILANKKEPLTQQHFDRWHKLWETTIDEEFSGENAQNAKQRAKTIGALIRHKIKVSENPSYM